MSMQTERFKEYSGNDADRVSLDKPETLAILEAADALLLYEAGTDGPNAGIARLGKIRDIRPGRSRITFRFRETGRVSRDVLVKYATLLDMKSNEFNRTHWAIKDGQINKLVTDQVKETKERYDVALSFAGEDREYVEKVASFLRDRVVSVFYDRFEEVEMWGKELTEHLDWVYRAGAQFCVMFISEHYGRKVWTNHERRSALAAALEQRREYILPVRFDDTELPGLRPTILHLNVKHNNPEELGAKILQKLGR